MKELKDIEPIQGIIVKQIEKAKKIGRIVIPDSADREQSNVGEIVGLPVAKNYPKFAVGDNIIFREFAGETIKIGSEEYLVLEPEDILARIKT